MRGALLVRLYVYGTEVSVETFGASCPQRAKFRPAGMAAVCDPLHWDYNAKSCPENYCPEWLLSSEPTLT